PCSAALADLRSFPTRRAADHRHQRLAAVAQPEPAAVQARKAGAVGLEHRLEFGVFVEVDHARLLQLEFTPAQLAAVERRPDLEAVAIDGDVVPAHGAA